MAPKLGDMLITYFTVGAVMWATGFIEWQEGGLLSYFLTLSGGDVAGADNINTGLESMGGPIANIVNTLGGGLLAVWRFISNLITFVFWPVEVLRNVGAPVEITVLAGGILAVAFVAGVLTMVRGSA